jgi:hypothetical protein
MATIFASCPAASIRLRECPVPWGYAMASTLRKLPGCPAAGPPHQWDAPWPQPHGNLYLRKRTTPPNLSFRHDLHRCAVAYLRGAAAPRPRASGYPPPQPRLGCAATAARPRCSVEAGYATLENCAAYGGAPHAACGGRTRRSSPATWILLKDLLGFFNAMLQ